MYQGIIIKSAPSDQPRDLAATVRYMLDIKHGGAKVPHDEAGPLSGSLNCASDTRKDQLHEFECQLRLHGNTRSTQAICHQIMSYPDGCRPTRKQIERDLRVLLKKYGMEEHPLVWDAHGNTRNFHVHFLLSRISQVPDHDGSFPIANNGVVKKVSKEIRKGGNAKVRVRTDWAACRQCAVAELNDIYEWGVQRNVRYTPDGTPISRQDPKDSHSDKTRVGERKSGKKSRERQLSDLGRRVFESSRSWHECDLVFASFAIEMTFKTKGSQVVGGYITGPDGRRCAFLQCGAECSYPTLAKRFGVPTPNDAACANEYYLMPFEYQDHLTVEEAKKRLLPVFRDAKSWPTLITDINHMGMRLERSGGGLIVRFNDNQDSIICSKIQNKFSLSRLEKALGPCPLPQAAPHTNPARELLIRDAQAIFSKHVAQQRGLFWMETDLEQANIRIVEKKFENNAGLQSYYAVEREGVSVQISHIAKDERGSPAYTMQLFERLDRNDPVVQRAKVLAEQKRQCEETNWRCSMGGDIYKEHMLQEKVSDTPGLFIDMFGNLVRACRRTHKPVNHGAGDALRRLDAMRDMSPLPGPFSSPRGPASFGALKP